MRLKTRTVLLCTLLAVGLLTGCGQSNPPADSSAGESVCSIPDEMRQKLTEIAEQKPVAVPAEGWTDESLLDVIYLNGTKMQMPFSLQDLGEDFGMLTGENYYLSGTSNAGENRSLATITYYGKRCGVAGIREILTQEAFKAKELSFIAFYKYPEEDTPELFPISVNGVTIGTSYADMTAKLGWTVEKDAEDPNTSGNSFSVIGYTETYYLKVMGQDAAVISIAFGYKDQ